MIKKGSAACLVLLLLLFSSCAPPPNNPIILCVGDSITESPYPHDLERILSAQGIRSRIVNRGRSGNTSGEYLSYLAGSKEELAALQADVILIQLGTNDVRIDHDSTSQKEFCANLQKIIAIFQEFRTRKGDPPKIFLATIPPIPDNTPFPFSRESRRRAEAEINPAVNEISQIFGLVVADHFRLFSESPDLMDGVHPTREGYKAMAAAWFEVLEKNFF